MKKNETMNLNEEDARKFLEAIEELSRTDPDAYLAFKLGTFVSRYSVSSLGGDQYLADWIKDNQKGQDK